MKNRQDYIKLKIFSVAKGTVNTVKRQPRERKKIFVNCVSEKGLIW